MKRLLSSLAICALMCGGASAALLFSVTDTTTLPERAGGDYNIFLTTGPGAFLENGLGEYGSLAIVGAHDSASISQLTAGLQSNHQFGVSPTEVVADGHVYSYPSLTGATISQYQITTTKVLPQPSGSVKFTILTQVFGTTSSGVPEPSSLLLSMMPIGLALLRRWRR